MAKPLRRIGGNQNSFHQSSSNRPRIWNPPITYTNIDRKHGMKTNIITVKMQ